MYPASRLQFRALFVVALAAAVFTFGCHKKPEQAPPPPPAPPPPAAKPTVSLQANPSSINKGDSSTLTWTSITASGPGGSADASARVTVEAPPPPPPPQPEATWRDLFNQEVKDAYFDYDKSDLRPDARSALNQTADFLKKYPEAKVTVEGHCDERGSTEYNLGLGDRRANAVKQYLVSLGISADR